MKKVIKVKLDPNSIEDAIKEIQAYKDELENKVRLLLSKMTEQGVEIAKAKVVEYGILHDAELTSSIRAYVSPLLGSGFIIVDDENAVFFEFGTGPLGAKKPHPLLPTYSSDAWYTRANGKPMDSMYGWKPYVDSDGNVYYLTIGQRAKPFMYDTAMELRERFPDIVKEVFG